MLLRGAGTAALLPVIPVILPDTPGTPSSGSVIDLLRIVTSSQVVG